MCNAYLIATVCSRFDKQPDFGWQMGLNQAGKLFPGASGQASLMVGAGGLVIARLARQQHDGNAALRIALQAWMQRRQAGVGGRMGQQGRHTKLGKGQQGLDGTQGRKLHLETPLRQLGQIGRAHV